jgi:hypothetical protein
MTQSLKEYDVVALLNNIPATHFLTGKPIMLPRGCTGTIVDSHIGEAALVEFADLTGRAFAIQAIFVENLVLLVHEPLAMTV